MKKLLNVMDLYIETIGFVLVVGILEIVVAICLVK